MDSEASVLATLDFLGTTDSVVDEDDDDDDDDDDNLRYASLPACKSVLCIPSLLCNRFTIILSSNTTFQY